MSGLGWRLALMLERYAPLRLEDKAAIEREMLSSRRYAPREILIREGSPVDRIFVMVEGFACRFKLLADGRRQITALMLPGDLCDTRSFLLPQLDHTVAAISPVEVVVLSAEAVGRLEATRGLAQALARNSMVHQSISREWMLNIGHRTSFERLTHLLCELFERLSAVRLTRGLSCDIPLTQTEIADALAISSVHVNRTLMEIRRTGLATFQSKHLTIHDYANLRHAANFDPGYLYIETPAPPAVEAAAGAD
jgi:CRP-like cAMP-binding protein